MLAKIIRQLKTKKKEENEGNEVWTMARQRKDGKRFDCVMRREVFETMRDYSTETGIPLTTVVEKSLEKYLEQYNQNKTQQSLFK